MITSESNYDDFRRFFNSHSRQLNVRLLNVLNKKYRRTILQILKEGREMPHFFASLKVEDDITLYALACGIREKKSEIEISSMFCFLIMKDLRKQTRIMVMDIPRDNLLGVIYDTHAISRYKERIGLDEEMDFVDVCKHMCAVGRCGSTRSITNFQLIHGSNPDHREMVLSCANGVFLGYYSYQKNMHYAETFLSPNELRENQAICDPTKDENMIRWNAHLDELYKGDLLPSEWEEIPMGNLVSIQDGEIKYHKLSETAQKFEEMETYRKEYPEFFQAQMEANKIKAANRIKRKGYK